MFDHLGGFLAISALLIVAPGPDMALVARNALRGGRRSGIATGVGVVSGLAVWTVAASVGLAALLRASEPAFVTLKIIGSVYLVCLGVRSLLDALRRTDAEGPRQRNGRSAHRLGLKARARASLVVVNRARCTRFAQCREVSGRNLARKAWHCGSASSALGGVGTFDLLNGPRTMLQQ